MDKFGLLIYARQRWLEAGLDNNTWSVFSELVFRADENGAVAAQANALMLASAVTNRGSFKRVVDGLVAAGLVAVDVIGQGRGQTVTYRLTGWVQEPEQTPIQTPVRYTGRLTVTSPSYTGSLTAVPAPAPAATPEAVPAPAPAETAVPETSDSLFPEAEPEPAAKPKQRQKRQKKETPDDLIKRPYGEHGRVLLTDREVELLNKKHPDWRNWLNYDPKGADDWLYLENVKKTDYYKYLVGWIKRNKNGQGRSYGYKYQPQVTAPEPSPEQTEEQNAAALAAAAYKQQQDLDNDWLGGLER